MAEKPKLDMDRKNVEKLVYKIIYHLAAILVIAILLGVAVMEHTKIEDPEERLQKFAEIYDLKSQINPNLPKPWPPKMNQKFPEFSVIDIDNNLINLYDLEAKIFVLEYVDVTSPVSQAYSNAGQYGVFGKASNTYDEEVQTFESIIERESRGAISFPHDDIIFLKVLIYNDAGKQATAVDAQAWAKHFQLSRENNYYVVVPEKDIRDELTDRLIPGFQVLDEYHNLRADASGSNPKHSYFTIAQLFDKLIMGDDLAEDDFR